MSTNESPKILLVDDIEANLFSLEQLLLDMELDCRIVKAQSGPDALSLIQQHDFALVLLDIMMPGMDGYEVAKQIREQYNKETLPLIFITADNGPKPLAKFMEAGAVGSLHKPVDPEQLQRKVSLFLNIYLQRVRRGGA